MKEFLLALQFLTIAPIKFRRVNEKDVARSVAYFPLAGLTLGIILAGIYTLLLWLRLPYISIDAILVVSLTVLTSGLHLDGLADTSDALLSRKNKEESLRVMRDPHVGVMGVLGIVSVLLLKISFLHAAGVRNKSILLILMCVLSKWGMVLVMFLFPYARQEGKAKTYIQGMNLKIFSLATIATLIISFLIYGIKGLLIMAILTLVLYLVNKRLQPGLGGITGDTLGFSHEWSEVIVLFLSIF